MDIALFQENIQLTTRELATKFGKSQTTIRYWMKKHGITSGRPACPRPKSLFRVDCDGDRKNCLGCGKRKSLDQFYKNGNGLHSRCKECLNNRTVERQRAFKAECIKYKGGKCVACGYNQYQGALEFHHLDPNEKDFNIASVRGLSFNNHIITELDKCVLLCATCHREAHADW